jgi:PAS domain-containing protein
MTDETLFTIGEVAAMVGVTAHTIRAWERRHNLLQPLRTMSRQRRYTADDIMVLLQVRHAVTMHGLSLKVAVRSAHGELTVPAGDARRPEPSAPVADDERVTRSGPSRSVWHVAADLMRRVIVILDGEGLITHANRAAAVLLGIPGDRLVGRPLADVLALAAPHADVHGLLREAARRGGDFCLELDDPPHSRRRRFECRAFRHEGAPMVAVLSPAATTSDRPRTSPEGAPRVSQTNRRASTTVMRASQA